MKLSKRKSERTKVKQLRQVRKRQANAAKEQRRRRRVREFVMTRRTKLRELARDEKLERIYEDLVRRGRELEQQYTVRLAHWAATKHVRQRM